MDIGSVKVIYFSPTGTTRKVVEAVVRGIGNGRVERIDITREEGRARRVRLGNRDLLVVGVPVYYGRAEEHAMEWLETVRGEGTPAVCVAVYGNRDYDDALVEVMDWAERAGCVPLAGAAYIGEHSFSGAGVEIAAGRPDEGDLVHAEALGRSVRERITALDSVEGVTRPEVPGNRPYMDVTQRKGSFSGGGFIALTGGCTQCGVCAALCPMGAIDEADGTVTDQAKCIYCAACIKGCPEKVRSMGAAYAGLVGRVRGLCEGRKEPVVFL